MTRELEKAASGRLTGGQAQCGAFMMLIRAAIVDMLLIISDAYPYYLKKVKFACRPPW